MPTDEMKREQIERIMMFAEGYFLQVYRLAYLNAITGTRTDDYSRVHTARTELLNELEAAKKLV